MNAITNTVATVELLGIAVVLMQLLSVLDLYADLLIFLLLLSLCFFLFLLLFAPWISTWPSLLTRHKLAIAHPDYCCHHCYCTTIVIIAIIIRRPELLQSSVIVSVSRDARDYVAQLGVGLIMSAVRRSAWYLYATPCMRFSLLFHDWSGWSGCLLHHE